MFASNLISQRLRVNYPIIQAPMFGVTTPEMVAAANRAGCLGSLPLGDLPAEKCREVIRTTRQLTNQDFAVNIFVNKIPDLTTDLINNYRATQQFLEQLAGEYHLTVKLPSIHDLQLTRYQEQIEVILSEGCKILSFTFGNLDSSSIQKLKNQGVTLIGTCTSVKEAIILEQSGIDIICVQGLEAGGHRGTFATEEIPEIGGFALLARVFDTVQVPIIYAGGIYNRNTLLAAQKLGAQGFQIGSLLLRSPESALLPFEKDRLEKIIEEDIGLIKSFTGRYARGIKNTFVEKVEHTPYILPYPYQNKLTGDLRRLAKAKQNTDFVSIWAGQSAHDLSDKSTTEILKNLIYSIQTI